MGVYRDPKSPYYWMAIEPPGLPRHRCSTKVPFDAPTERQRQLHRRIAEHIYRNVNSALEDALATTPGLKGRTIDRRWLAAPLEVATTSARATGNARAGGRLRP